MPPETTTKTAENPVLTVRQKNARQRLINIGLIIPGDSDDVWLFDDPHFIRDGHQERVLYLHAKGILLQVDPTTLQNDINRIDPQYQLPKPWRYENLDRWAYNLFETLKGKEVRWD